MSATIERRLASIEAAILPPAPRRSPVEVASALGIALDHWQRELVLADWRQGALLCSRQAGKSMIADLLALTTALYTPGALVLILSPTERQSGLLFRTILKRYRQLGYPVAAEVENRLSLELANGSAIHALQHQAGPDFADALKIAAWLECSPDTVARHANKLLTAGILAVRTVQPSEKGGRPKKVYDVVGGRD